MNKNIISGAIATVTLLLAGFGGLISDMQPPVLGFGKAVGFITSFGALIVLLIIAAITRSLKATILKYIWIAFGFLCLLIFIKTALDYSDLLNDYTVVYNQKKETRYVVGDILDKDGIKTQAYLLKSGTPVTKYNLIANGGSTDNIIGIWTERSVNIRTKRLVHDYVFVILFMTAGVFSITEGVFGKEGTLKRGAQNHKEKDNPESNKDLADSDQDRGDNGG